MCIAWFFALIVGIASSFAMTPEQSRNLKIAKEIGKEYGWPETAQVIIMQETLAGHLTKYGDRKAAFGKKSYGIAQMQLNTAKFIIKKHFGHKVFSCDEEIITTLVTNDKFAIHLAMWYFKYLMNMFDGNWKKAILAYNVGPGNVQKYGFKHDPNKYLKKCIWRLKNEIRPFNRRLK